MRQICVTAACALLYVLVVIPGTVGAQEADSIDYRESALETAPTKWDWDDDAPLDGKEEEASFKDHNGRTVHWKKLTVGFSATSIDRRSASGPLVFAGAPFTINGLLESNDCDGGGCHAYKVMSDGTVKELFSERNGFGIVDIAVSPNGRRVAATSLNQSAKRHQGRLWHWSKASLRSRKTFSQGSAVESSKKRFIATAGRGQLYKSSGTGAWKQEKLETSCAFFDLSLATSGTILAGWSGTFVDRGKGEAKRIGPSSKAVWSSNNGKTIAIAPIIGKSKLLMSNDGGRSWKSQRLIDKIGKGPCSNNKKNMANDCYDFEGDARIEFMKIAGTGPRDIWAIGGRADITGGRLYRYVGKSRWERVLIPGDIIWAGDIVINRRGRPLIASLNGIFQLEDR